MTAWEDAPPSRRLALIAGSPRKISGTVIAKIAADVDAMERLQAEMRLALGNLLSALARDQARGETFSGAVSVTAAAARALLARLEGTKDE
jgi:hypothetical protein